MAVSKQKQDELIDWMKRLNIREDELVEKFILGSGPGGQKVNKSASTVYLKHLPTQIAVKCGEDRSQEINRFLARRKLCEQVEKKLFGTPTKKEKEIEKIKKQKRRKIRRTKRKLVDKTVNNI